MGMGMGITGEGMEKGSPRSAVQCAALGQAVCFNPFGILFLPPSVHMFV